jgi:hypothetical protein
MAPEAVLLDRPDIEAWESLPPRGNRTPSANNLRQILKFGVRPIIDQVVNMSKAIVAGIQHSRE